MTLAQQKSSASIPPPPPERAADWARGLVPPLLVALLLLFLAGDSLGERLAPQPLLLLRVRGGGCGGGEAGLRVRRSRLPPLRPPRGIPLSRLRHRRSLTRGRGASLGRGERGTQAGGFVGGARGGIRAPPGQL